MYVCGVTVYDLCHLGHARTFAAFDMIVRYLRFRGYDVTFVRNITDIDDKIIQRARDTGEDWRSLTERMVHEMHIDFAKLGILPPDIEPRPTEHIPQIISMIERLLHRQFAYIAENGDVMFSTASAKDYGKLSGQDITMLRAGTRIEVNEYKRDPLDFVLWKRAKPGEPVWPSPWGEGRPGWHIECSAMNCHYLGTHFDIHGGGSDLIFPHHENEIAQSTSANDGPYVNYWLHTGMVTVNKEKMSKSLNNFFTLRDILHRFDAQSVRFFLLGAHYRKPLNYSEENIHIARASLTRLYTACQFADGSRSEQHDAWRARFCEAMDDDFNTADALAAVFELVKFANTNVQEGSSKEFTGHTLEVMTKLCDVLGLTLEKKEEILDEEIENLIAERQAARKAKDFARADEIRGLLLDKGIELKDTREGVKWKRI